MTKTDRFMLKSAVHLLFVMNSRVLLARRYNTGYEDGNYSVPAGHIDGGESVRAAAVREALEEIGVVVSLEDLRFGHVMHRRSDDERIDFFFVVSKWSNEPRIAEPDRCDELHWADPDVLPDNTVPYVAEGIRLALSGQVFSEYGW